MNEADPPEEPATSWKRYPFALSETDPELVFPGAEGDQGAESNTYYVAGRLRGRMTGHEWAFLVIFTFNDVRHLLRADFHTLALFDLASGSYGTSTEFDFPRLFQWRKGYRLAVARGQLDVSFQGSGGESSWRTRRAADGSLEPFAYTLSAIGFDAEGRKMRLDLELDPLKPPMLVGGQEYQGVKTCMGQYGTHSYFQSDVRFRGTLAWGDMSEEVEGGSGWIDRQWAPRYLGAHTDRKNTRYRHEWRQIHLDSGIEMSVWMHFDRHRSNRPIPFTGATAAGPQGQLDATTEVEVERLSFVRDPGHVQPLYPLDGAKYFTDRYRLRIPQWDLDLVSEPLVAAPAHWLPIEYWSGPTSIAGTLGGAPVAGFGFHERTLCFSRDFELVDVLRQSLKQLPPEAFAETSMTPVTAANLAWEIDGFLSHHDQEGALRHLISSVRPVIARLAEPHQAHLLQIADDTADALLRWWVRP